MTEKEIIKLFKMGKSRKEITKLEFDDLKRNLGRLTKEERSAISFQAMKNIEQALLKDWFN